jgi:hypothetical protein
MKKSGYDCIPPFPNVFREKYGGGDSKFNELLWIGEEDGFKDFKEVEFINNLFDGVIAVKKATNEIFKREAANADAINNTYNWYPTGILDYAHTSNPYIEMVDEMSHLSNDQKPGYLHVFAKKRIQAAWATCEESGDNTGKAIAQLEAYNFVKANPVVPSYLLRFFKEDNMTPKLREAGADYEKNHEEIIFKEISPYFTCLDKSKGTKNLYFGKAKRGDLEVEINDFFQILYDIH